MQVKKVISSDDGSHLFSAKPLLKLVLTPKIAEYYIVNTDTTRSVPLSQVLLAVALGPAQALVLPACHPRRSS